ncbi:hypothetical protein FHS57_003956 [Runella defluvii]|uniref:Uncharacterized protein n=1 Tax=Runella defluvii TaxID=370973 RepID=A0A7W5ZMC1_9BACT|nr:hypothetical protein [Runella defluvii]MBB3839945.1 hypothetical protein [Runella defluvii]HAK80367.1 hypothetical protein [Runella sp.]HAO51797.1 hypothetical protein [Runella sp.]
MTTKAISVNKLSTSRKTAKTIDDGTVEMGAIQESMKPSDLFRGVWRKNKKRLSANEVRNEAWQRNK